MEWHLAAIKSMSRDLQLRATKACRLLEQVLRRHSIGLMTSVLGLEPQVDGLRWDASRCQLDTASEAARVGDLQLMQWLRQQPPACPMLPLQCVIAAAEAGDMNIATWLLPSALGSSILAEMLISLDRQSTKVYIHFRL